MTFIVHEHVTRKYLIYNIKYTQKNNDRGGLVFIPVMWSKHNYSLLKVQCFETFSKIFHNGSAHCMAFVWGITLQKLCMILVLPVKDTVGRKPLLKVLTFLNQEQETTIICREKISQSILALCALINTTDLLNAVTDSLRVSAFQWPTLHRTHSLRNILHLQQSKYSPEPAILSFWKKCYSIAVIKK